MRLKILGPAGVVAAMLTAPIATDLAFAHHSHAMFDFERAVELEGTVKEFKWTNPHSWLHITMADEQGETVEFAIEMGSPAGLVHQGWRPTTVVPGDRVMVSIHPLRDGNNGGELRYIVLPDGRSLGEGHENAEFPDGIPRQ